jgi:caffeoyl-CoA O-methyltransferase
MDLINHTAEAYATELTTALGPVLEQVHAQTLANHPLAHMISGPVQGMLLQFISGMLRPQRILEVGTFTGYSAICLAAGLQPGGKLHTIECRQADADTAQAHINAAGMAHCIQLHVGDAKTLIPQMDESWDLAFIDADKTGYIEYYELILPKLKQGGYIIADNVLFHGEVLVQPLSGKNAKAIDAFNRHVAADERVQQVMLTVRDGLLLIKKL